MTATKNINVDPETHKRLKVHAAKRQQKIYESTDLLLRFGLAAADREAETGQMLKFSQFAADQEEGA